MKKLIFLIVVGIIFLTACGKSDDEKFLEGKWKGTNNDNEMMFKNGKQTIITDGGKETKPYKVEKDDDENIITIATDGKEFNDDFDGFTFYSEYGKDGDKVEYLMSYLINDETGNYANQYTVDGNGEKFEKTSSFSFASIGKGILTVIFIGLIAFGAIRAYKMKQGSN